MRIPRIIAKIPKTTLIGFSIPLILAVIRLFPEERLVFKIFGRVSNAPGFSPLFFPAPTVYVDEMFGGIYGGYYTSYLGSHIVSFLVVIGLLIFLGGFLLRTPRGTALSFIKRWFLGNLIFFSYLLVFFEIPTFLTCSKDCYVLLGIFWFFLQLALVATTIEVAILFFIWRKNQRATEQNRF